MDRPLLENKLLSKNENARVLHLPRIDLVQTSPNNFDLNPVNLNYDL